MSNAQILDDLRYCAENFICDKTRAELNLRQFASGLISANISSPAQKPAPELGGSSAGLVGNPRVIPGSVVKISIDRFSRVNLCSVHLTKPSGFWFRHCDVTSRHGEFLGRRAS